MESSDALETLLADGWKGTGLELLEAIRTHFGVNISRDGVMPLPRGGWALKTYHAGWLSTQTSFGGVRFSLPRSAFSQDTVVVRGIPSHYSEQDLHDFVIPAPLSVERFKNSRLVKFIFNEQDAKKVLSSGLTYGYMHYKCEPFMNKKSVYCRKCKSLDKNHPECELRCGKCGEAHVTKECPGEKITCVHCANPEEPHTSFKCPKVLKKQQDVFKKMRKSYAESAGKVSSSAAANIGSASVNADAVVEEGEILPAPPAANSKSKKSTPRYADIANSLPSASGSAKKNKIIVDFQASLDEMRKEFQVQLQDMQKSLLEYVQLQILEIQKQTQEMIKQLMVTIQSAVKTPGFNSPTASSPCSSRNSRNQGRSRSPPLSTSSSSRK